jgi:hypothetical protein
MFSTERGQIEGGILDGPLAFDNAISKESGATKRIVSNVAGEDSALARLASCALALLSIHGRKAAGL